jgi:hypothetical protein
MHQAEDVWNDDMLKTAGYVERIADEDSVIVLSGNPCQLLFNQFNNLPLRRPIWAFQR